MIQDFIRKTVRNGESIKGVVNGGMAILNGRVSERQKPPHVPDQRDLMHEWFHTDEERWLIFFDAGRYDIFDQLVWEYFDGNLKRAWNGGKGYTGDWTKRTLETDFGNRGLWSWVPMSEFGAVDYEPLEWFNYAPDIHAESTVQNRLATLGYTEGDVDSGIRFSPAEVNQSVLNAKDELNGGIVRYLKPHPPFDGLTDLTSESTKTAKTQVALENGELTYEELTEAYIQTYRKAFEAAVELVPELDGPVILTSDHGTCLSCGQLFHGRHLEKHDHLTIVPWFEVDRIT